MRIGLLQVIVGDLLNIENVRRAAKGVDYMFFTFAVQDGLLEATTIAALAAAEAGVLFSGSPCTVATCTIHHVCAQALDQSTYAQLIRQPSHLLIDAYCTLLHEMLIVLHYTKNMLSNTVHQKFVPIQGCNI